MSDNRKFYWLKLKHDFFKRHDIRILEEMENGKDYILFYLKLLLESISHEGQLRFSETIPYNEKMLSVITNTNIDIVRSAMKVLIELKMIEILDDSTIYMSEVQKLTGSETKWAEYKRNKKTTLKDLPPLKECKRLSYESIQLPNGKVQYVDEKRYGCNGGLAFDRAKGKCEICDSEENLVIHHNNGYSNELEDLLICCKKCHARLEKVQGKSKLLPTEIEKEIEKEKDIEIEGIKSDKPTRTRFKPPTLEEVKAYCRERQNGVNPEKFIDHYTSNGWKVGKNPMKDWKAAVRTWERSEFKPQEKKTTGNVFLDILNSGEYDD